MASSSCQRSFHRTKSVRFVCRIGRKKQILLGFFSFVFVFGVCGCSISPSTTGPLKNPEDVLTRMKSTIDADDKFGFMDTLCEETLNKYENGIILAWDEVREYFYFSTDDVTVLNIEKAVDIKYEDSNAPSDYVFPCQDKPAWEVTVSINYEGKKFEEKFLFLEEIREAEANTQDSGFIKLRDEYFRKEDHPTPKRYLKDGLSVEERTNWCLVYPYYEFEYQRDSKLALALIKKMQEEGE